jgi:hypothetical protein
MPFDALPEFNPNATGPQGTPGIPPEEINAALSMVGQVPKPEDSSAAQSVLDHQAGHVMAQLGITPEADPNVPAPAPVPAAPQYPQAVPSPGTYPDTQGGQTPAAPQDIAGRIATIQAKFGGDFNQLANAHVHAQRGMTQAQQAAAAQGGQIQDLQQSVAQLTATVHGAIQNLNAGGGYPGRPTSFQGTQEGSQPEITREAYDEDPVGTISRVVSASVQENLTNYEIARRQQQEEDQAKARYKERAAEYDQWRPRMNQIFQENPTLYAGMQPYDVMALLYERAKERQGLETAQLYHQQINQELGLQPPQGIPGTPQPQVDPNGSPYPMVPQGAPQGIPPQVPPGYGPVPPGYGMTPPQPAPGAYTMPGQPTPYQYPTTAAMPGQPGYNIPTGPGGGMRTTVPGQPPGGSWSKTPGMQHLWNAKSDSQDEMRAITTVLEERGFGNHLG